MAAKEAVMGRYSIPQAAVILGISERTLYRRIKAGDIQVEKEGRRTWVILDPKAAIAAEDALREKVEELRLNELELGRLGLSEDDSKRVETFSQGVLSLIRSNLAGLYRTLSIEERAEIPVEAIKRLELLKANVGQVLFWIWVAVTLVVVATTVCLFSSPQCRETLFDFLVH